MPHFGLKIPKINIDKVSAELLTYAEILIREYAEKKIAEIIDYLRQQCPPPEVIERMLKVTNKINKQITKAGKRAEKVKKQSDTLKIAIDAAKVVIEIIAHFNIPVALGTPCSSSVIHQNMKFRIFFMKFVDYITYPSLAT